MRTVRRSSISDNMSTAGPPKDAPQSIPGNEDKTPISGEEKVPLLEDVMQLSRLGEIEPLRLLFEEKKVSIDFKDDQGITPLHVRLTNKVSFLMAHANQCV